MIYHYSKHLLVTFVLLFFSACSFTSTQSAQTLPQWFLNTPQNSNTTLYGSGQATTLQEAKNRALNDLASRLSVQVNSKIEQSTYRYSNQDGASTYNNSTQQNIEVLVKNIEFQNPKVIQSAFIAQQFFVLVEVNREELYRQQHNAFLRLYQHIETQYKKSQIQSKLEQIHLLQSLSDDIQKAAAQAQLLNAINGTFDDNHYLNYFNTINNQALTLKNSLRISISDNLEYTYFSSKVIEYLNHSSYKVVSKSEDVKIALNSSVNYSVAMGWQIAKVTTSLHVIAQGKVLSSHTIHSVGRSTSSQNSALISASREFAQKLQDRTIEAILLNQ